LGGIFLQKRYEEPSQMYAKRQQTYRFLGHKNCKGRLRQSCVSINLYRINVFC
jgi:hypothetical protein